jgi:hypothetical protein
MAAFTVLPSRSAAVRSYHESHVLEALAGRTATVALSGFLFFGSSTLLSAQVSGWVGGVAARRLANCTHGWYSLYRSCALHTTEVLNCHTKLNFNCFGMFYCSFARHSICVPACLRMYATLLLPLSCPLSLGTQTPFHRS